VKNTGVIGLIKIVGEESVASGVRRIEVTTGRRSYEFAQDEDMTLHHISDAMHMPVQHLENGVRKHIEIQKRLEREVRDLELKLISGQGGAFEDFTAGDIKARIYPLQTLAPDAVAKLLDKAVEEDRVHIAFAVTDHDGRGTLMIRCSDEGVKTGLHAGNFVKKVAGAMGGRGGGKPSFARGGVDASRYEEGSLAYRDVLTGGIT
jgi:alanyl-tRNA synthetase